VRYYDAVQMTAQDSAVHYVLPRPLFHPALVVRSSPDQVALLFLWAAAGLTESAQAARITGSALALAHASVSVTVGPGDELACWGSLYEDSSVDLPSLAGIDLDIALGTEPSAAD
jgi:hypothetical protein